MAESHGTRELLAPHPETAAQTHGWRQPFETSDAGIWPLLNHTERVNS